MDRRLFLKASGVTLLSRPLRAEPEIATQLVAGVTSQQLLPTHYGGETAVYGFNGSVPGPTLRATRGDTLHIAFRNKLPVASSVHWHGIRLDNAMDGVPALTQDPVKQNETFDYRISLPDAGTYWYHAHHMSHEQVARGLFGPLIIDELNAPDVDHDVTVVLSDWRLDHDASLAADFGNRHDIAHAGRLGNFPKASLSPVVLRRGERVRWRFINASVDRIFPLLIKGLDGKVVALDGMPLPIPRAFDPLVLAPAQRADVIADVIDTVDFSMAHRMGPYPLATLPTDGSIATRGHAVESLPPNTPPPTDTSTRTLRMLMSGGAMSRGHSGDGIWAFNGQSGMSDEPFAKVSRGETVRISLVNDTRFPHGIHLHGHHFHELEQDGSPGDLRDTSLVSAGETRDIQCTFDNPGKWMLHCHMLSHQFGGMKTWVDVA